MTHTLLKTISLAIAMLAIVLTPMLASTDAEAKKVETTYHAGQSH